VYNKWTNYLTKMQAVRYYVAFRFFKAAESIFDAVTCLSGPLACYRKDLVLKYLEPWCFQTFMGLPATFGDDRSMTNFILSGARTSYQDTAICHTIVPSGMKQFLRQQMRWKRSWLRESLRAATFIWKKEPAMSVSFYIGLMIPILAPIIVTYSLIIHPIASGAFPSVYLVGFFSMATLMSAAYLLFRKSDLWIYGFAFCFFYLAVLLWQMPWAVLTFATSNWGTRDTSLDKNFIGGKRLPSPYTVQTQEVTPAA
jgi:hyaluronan synthase